MCMPLPFSFSLPIYLILSPPPPGIKDNSSIPKVCMAVWLISGLKLDQFTGLTHRTALKTSVLAGLRATCCVAWAASSSKGQGLRNPVKVKLLSPKPYPQMFQAKRRTTGRDCEILVSLVKSKLS